MTAVLRYDPVGRLVRTDAPDGTHTKVEFDAWKQVTGDANDTVVGTPWYDAMQAGTAALQRAADLSEEHKDTPAVAHLDSLGRVFLTVEDNGALGTRDTRLELDIEGQTLSVTDARDVKVLEQTYDRLGNVLASVSVDAGPSQVLADVAGNPVRSWEGRGYAMRRQYDLLQRPTHAYAKLDTEPERLVERFVYGEQHPDAEEHNLRLQLHQAYDGAGVAISAAFGFHGNLVRPRMKAKPFRPTTRRTCSRPSGCASATLPFRRPHPLASPHPCWQHRAALERWAAVEPVALRCRAGATTEERDDGRRGDVRSEERRVRADAQDVGAPRDAGAVLRCEVR